MRKIKNDARIQKIVNDFYDTVFYRRKKNEFKKPAVRLRALRRSPKIYPGITAAQKTGYIDLLLSNLDRIMRVQPNFINSWILLFEGELPAASMTTAFSNDIQWALCYEQMRSVEFPEVYQKMEIKTCVYCHSQLTVVVDKTFYKISVGTNKVGDVNERIAKLELDHFKDKSTYPFLSSSFYNLYPVCANCNKAKSNNPAAFELYADGEPLDVFRFSLNTTSVLDYWASGNIKDIKISFLHVEDNLKERRLYNATFDVLEIYQTQLDIVEELIHKKRVYTNLYKKSLKDQFEDLFPDKALIKRLILGNYDKPDDVHKRPMAKFIQDIAIDLKLI